jgi:hypothetical protein
MVLILSYLKLKQWPLNGAVSTCNKVGTDYLCNIRRVRGQAVVNTVIKAGKLLINPR